MNREEFNLLEIEKQVEVFNKMLKNSSIRKVCSELKISKTTIRNRFKKRGYIFNSEKNIYIKEKEIKRNYDPTIKEEKVSNINLTKEIYFDLLELIEIKDDLKDIVNNWKERTVASKQGLCINAFEGELCVKSIKVYKEVLDKFNEFVKKHRELKQQDIINQALWEFLQKYM
ncbi:hypothetical protein FQB35_02305 [Crassaminicella thermophila]|uniref:Uncharacterized protein n=1 Tax=Crassaminicella thermophila TaxID=2599308 RepID=A0A5C0SBJ9_CRATE|nr:hypothetical protein [Crassaminicella thermophila]QEK11292.1 hypothetical protein FQB35_02305 [Crassaminicella thermophila]